MSMIYAYAAGIVVLLGCAIAILRTYCESYGCMGIAVMWLVWAAGFGLWLVFGLNTMARAKKTNASLWPAKAAFLVQLGLGALLFVYWAVKNAA